MENRTDKIIFLDIDGVLWTHDWAEKCYNEGKQTYMTLDPRCVDRLNSLLKQTGASVVLSSVWRLNHNWQQLLTEKGVEANWLGRTEFICTKSPTSDPTLHVERGHEIQKWLDDNKFEGGFVIIDDDSDMAHLYDRLVQTNGDVGLSDADCEKVKALFG